MIIVNENEKVIRNVRHIDIYYHHIQNLIEKKIIEISHISTNEMTVNNFTKMLLSNKFKEFIELVRISRIEIDSKTGNSKTSNDDKNNENFVTNYYKKADKKADKKISFKIKKTK